MRTKNPFRPLDPITALWWVRLPALLRRVAPGLAAPLLDGQYLVCWPVASMVASPIALLLGLYMGQHHPEFKIVFTESLDFMILAAAIGMFSAHLGAFFLAGFVFGHFFLLQTHWTEPGGYINHFLRVRIPLLIEYGLLGLLVVTTPLAARELVAGVRLPRLLGRHLAFVIALLGFPAVVGLLVFFWTNAVPLLIRPLWTWQGQQPTVDAMAPLQKTGMTLVYVAVAAALIRVVLQGIPIRRPALGARLERLEVELEQASEGWRLVDRVSQWVPAILLAVWSTVMMSGMFLSWFEALVVGVVMVAIAALRTGLVPLPLWPWQWLMSRVPVVLRLGAGFLLISYVAQDLLRKPLPAALAVTQFRVIIFLSCVALVISYLFNPGAPRRRPSRAALDTPTGTPPTGTPPAETQAAPAATVEGSAPAGATVLSVVVALAGGLALLLYKLVFPETAFADNCSGYSDCWGTTRAAIAAGVGVAGGVLVVTGWRSRAAGLFDEMLDRIPVTQRLNWVYQWATGRPGRIVSEARRNQELEMWGDALQYFPEEYWWEISSAAHRQRLWELIWRRPAGLDGGGSGGAGAGSGSGTGSGSATGGSGTSAGSSGSIGAGGSAPTAGGSGSGGGSAGSGGTSGSGAASTSSGGSGGDGAPGDRDQVVRVVRWWANASAQQISGAVTASPAAQGAAGDFAQMMHDLEPAATANDGGRQFGWWMNRVSGNGLFQSIAGQAPVEAPVSGPLVDGLEATPPDITPADLTPADVAPSDVAPAEPVEAGDRMPDAGESGAARGRAESGSVTGGPGGDVRPAASEAQAPPASRQAPPPARPLAPPAAQGPAVPSPSSTATPTATPTAAAQAPTAPPTPIATPTPTSEAAPTSTPTPETTPITPPARNLPATPSPSGAAGPALPPTPPAGHAPGALPATPPPETQAPTVPGVLLPRQAATCSACGAALEPGDRFCRKCGQPVPGA